jgi:hypothetical protein
MCSLRISSQGLAAAEQRIPAERHDNPRTVRVHARSLHRATCSALRLETDLGSAFPHDRGSA